MKGGDGWLEECTLGPRQKETFIRYMKDVSIWDHGLTEVGEYLKKLYSEDKETVWQILWFNLCINSDLFRWYVKTFGWEETITKEKLIAVLQKEHIKERTARNAINSLVNTFRSSPLGNWFGKEIKKNVFLKKGLETAKPELIRYCRRFLFACDDEDLNTTLGLPREEIYRLKAIDIISQRNLS